MTSGIDWAKPFFESNSDIEVIEAFVIDVNGQARGKWIPFSSAGKALKGELRLPRSSCLRSRRRRTGNRVVWA